MPLTRDAKDKLQAEFNTRGISIFLQMLIKNTTSLSNIDINSRAKIIEYLTLQIKKKQSSINKTAKNAHIHANINNFKYFIETFNTNILKEKDTLKEALKTNGSDKLIRMLTLTFNLQIKDN